MFKRKRLLVKISRASLLLIAAVGVMAACKAKEKQSSRNIQQGIEGRVLAESGNQMPMKGNRQTVLPKGFATTVYVFKSINLSEIKTALNGMNPRYSSINAKLICAVKTGSSGYFSIRLPIGVYSLLVNVDDSYYANRYDEKNNVNTYKVERNKVTHSEIVVTATASY